MADVSCVVVAFHRPGALQRLLKSLADDRVERLVVNVEDDHEVDDVARAEGAEVVDFPINRGYAAAVNRGAARAGPDVVVFLNDDLETNSETVLALAAIVRAGEADVAVPRLVTSEGRTELTIAALPTPGALAVEWMATPDAPVAGVRRVLPLQKWRLPGGRERVMAASGAIVACRRALLAEVPLPEDYFLYWEESEWFWWLARRGERVVYEPALVVTHSGGRGDVRPDKSRLLARNAVRCVRRTQGRGTALAAWPIVVAWNARLVVADAARAERRGRLAARWAGLGAAVRAVREVL